MSNLDLWNSVEKTDTTFTKHVNQRGGYTAISPQYQLKLATEKFGSYGDGFGLSESDFDMSIYEFDGVVIHKAVFFYRLNGERVEFPITNAIQAAKQTKNGKFVDVDFAKKVETNTLSKALSKLGFNADIFLGMFEDNDYLQELNNEMAIKKADDKDAEVIKQREEWREWKQKEITAYKSIPNLNALELVYAGHVRKIKRRGDEQALVMFAKTYELRKGELNES